MLRKLKKYSFQVSLLLFYEEHLNYTSVISIYNHWKLRKEHENFFLITTFFIL